MCIIGEERRLPTHYDNGWNDRVDALPVNKMGIHNNDYLDGYNACESEINAGHVIEGHPEYYR